MRERLHHIAPQPVNTPGENFSYQNHHGGNNQSNHLVMESSTFSHLQGGGHNSYSPHRFESMHSNPGEPSHAPPIPPPPTQHMYANSYQPDYMNFNIPPLSTQQISIDASNSFHHQGITNGPYQNLSIGNAIHHKPNLQNSSSHRQNSSSHHPNLQNSSPNHPNLQNSSPHRQNSSPQHPNLQNSSSHHPNLQNSSPHYPNLQNSSPHHPNLQNSSPHHPNLQNSSSHHPNLQNSSPHYPNLQNSSPHHPNLQNSSPHHPNLQNSSPHHPNSSPHVQDVVPSLPQMDVAFRSRSQSVCYSSLANNCLYSSCNNYPQYPVMRQGSKVAPKGEMQHKRASWSAFPAHLAPSHMDRSHNLQNSLSQSIDNLQKNMSLSSENLKKSKKKIGFGSMKFTPSFLRGSTASIKELFTGKNGSRSNLSTTPERETLDFLNERQPPFGNFHHFGRISAAAANNSQNQNYNSAPNSGPYIPSSGSHGPNPIGAPTSLRQTASCTRQAVCCSDPSCEMNAGSCRRSRPNLQPPIYGRLWGDQNSGSGGSSGSCRNSGVFTVFEEEESESEDVSENHIGSLSKFKRQKSIPANVPTYQNHMESFEGDSVAHRGRSNSVAVGSRDIRQGSRKQLFDHQLMYRNQEKAPAIRCYRNLDSSDSLISGIDRLGKENVTPPNTFKVPEEKLKKSSSLGQNFRFMKSKDIFSEFRTKKKSKKAPFKFISKLSKGSKNKNSKGDLSKTSPNSAMLNPNESQENKDDSSDAESVNSFLGFMRQRSLRTNASADVIRTPTSKNKWSRSSLRASTKSASVKSTHSNDSNSSLLGKKDGSFSYLAFSQRRGPGAKLSSSCRSTQSAPMYNAKECEDCFNQSNCVECVNHSVNQQKMKNFPSTNFCNQSCCTSQVPNQSFHPVPCNRIPCNMPNKVTSQSSFNDLNKPPSTKVKVSKPPSLLRIDVPPTPKSPSPSIATYASPSVFASIAQASETTVKDPDVESDYASPVDNSFPFTPELESPMYANPVTFQEELEIAVSNSSSKPPSVTESLSVSNSMATLQSCHSTLSGHSSVPSSLSRPNSVNRTNSGSRSNNSHSQSNSRDCTFAKTDLAATDSIDSAQFVSGTASRKARAAKMKTALVKSFNQSITSTSQLEFSFAEEPSYENFCNTGLSNNSKESVEHLDCPNYENVTPNNVEESIGNQQEVSSNTNSVPKQKESSTSMSDEKECYEIPVKDQTLYSFFPMPHSYADNASDDVINDSFSYVGDESSAGRRNGGVKKGHSTEEDMTKRSVADMIGDIELQHKGDSMAPALPCRKPYTKSMHSLSSDKSTLIQDTVNSILSESCVSSSAASKLHSSCFDLSSTSAKRSYSNLSKSNEDNLNARSNTDLTRSREYSIGSRTASELTKSSEDVICARSTSNLTKFRESVPSVTFIGNSLNSSSMYDITESNKEVLSTRSTFNLTKRSDGSSTHNLTSSCDVFSTCNELPLNIHRSIDSIQNGRASEPVINNMVASDCDGSSKLLYQLVSSTLRPVESSRSKSAKNKKSNKSGRSRTPKSNRSNKINNCNDGSSRKIYLDEYSANVSPVLTSAIDLQFSHGSYSNGDIGDVISDVKGINSTGNSSSIFMDSADVSQETVNSECNSNDVIASEHTGQNGGPVECSVQKKLNILKNDLLQLKAQDQTLMKQFFNIHTQIMDIKNTCLGPPPIEDDNYYSFGDLPLPSPPACLTEGKKLAYKEGCVYTPPNSPPGTAPPCPDHLRAPIVYELIRQQNLQRTPDGTLQDGKNLVTSL